MDKTCGTCQFSNLGLYDTPCKICELYSHWRESTELKRKSATQCWLELITLYDYQLRCNEGIDEKYYEMKMEQFKDILSQFKNAVASEERETNWYGNQ